MYDKENAIPDDELYLDHLNCGGEGVAVADTRGVVQSVSPAFGRLMGLKAPELVGRHLENLWQETSCEPMADVWPVLLSTGYWQGQVHCPRTEPLLFTINVAINQQGTVSHYVITCRKQNKNANHTEESLCAPESAVLAHQKLVSLTAMSAGVAHEIAQPLNAIKVLADGMLFWHKRGHSLPQGRVIDKIENISQQADRINSIIKHIRSLASTGNTLELSPCSVNTAVENALDLLGRQLSSHGIVVKMELADNLPPILGDLRRLEEAIINLLVNARQALDEVSRPDKIITCLTRTNRSKVILDISDNAYGIDAERKKLLFEPFFTTKSGQQGMGLGLSIVQSIVAAFKGHIYAYTNDQGGATFRIELPALKAPTEVTMMNILLVDDEQDSRTFMAEFLEGLGHEVTEKADGQEALNAFASDSFHLVLTDIKMPRMSGLELLHNIRHLPGGTEVNVVVFTAYGDLHTSVQALRAGAYDYLLKPINIDELVHLTERIAEHQALQRQNHFLTNKFDNVVEAAVSETKHELSRLQQAYLTNQGLGQIGIFSPALRKIFDQAAKLHPNRSIPVLIEGETGTGKDLVARYLHYGQGECTEPFIALNCAALTPSLFESELFGYEGGAFTGSQPRGRKGKLDMAQGGTLFLDEISEMPVNLQAKLLRVIQEKAFYRVGGLKKVPLDVRFICATNQDITAMVEKGTFRQDLYYRLNVARIQLPPLRERREEIIPLAHMFLGEFFQSEARPVPVIGSEAGEILQNYEWPGNVRELRNVMEYAALIWDDELELQPHHLKLLERSKPIRVSDASDHPSWLDHQNFTLPPGSLPLKELTDNIIRQALKMHQGNKTATARYLGISRRSLYSRLKHISDQD